MKILNDKSKMVCCSLHWDSWIETKIYSFYIEKLSIFRQNSRFFRWIQTFARQCMYVTIVDSTNLIMKNKILLTKSDIRLNCWPDCLASLETGSHHRGTKIHINKIPERTIFWNFMRIFDHPEFYFSSSLFVQIFIHPDSIAQIFVLRKNLRHRWIPNKQF